MRSLYSSLRLGLYDVGEFIERQTNQQQKAKLEKQMYNTLTVRPNIVKPLLATGGELIEPWFCISYLQLERKEAVSGTEIIYRQQATTCRTLKTTAHKILPLLNLNKTTQSE